MAILLKILPFLSGIIDKFWPDAGRAAEIRAQAELEEIRAFSQGRISPRYAMRYALAGLLTVFGLLAIVNTFWPHFFSTAPLFELKALIEAARHLGDLL